MARLFKTCPRCGYDNYADAYTCAKCCSSIMTMPASRQGTDWVAWSVPIVLLLFIGGGVAISRPAAPEGEPSPEPVSVAAEAAPQPAFVPEQPRVFASNPVTASATTAPVYDIVWEMPQDPPNPRIKADYNRRRLLAIRQAMQVQSGGTAGGPNMGGGPLPAGMGPQGPSSGSGGMVGTASAGLVVPSDAVPSGAGYDRWKQNVIAAIVRKIRATSDTGALQDIQSSMLSLPRREADTDFDRRLDFLDKAVTAKMQGDGLSAVVSQSQKNRLSEQNIRLATT